MKATHTRRGDWMPSEGPKSDWGRIIRAIAQAETERPEPGPEGRAGATPTSGPEGRAGAAPDRSSPPSGFYLMKAPEADCLRVLLVLDDPELRRLAKRRLRRLRSGEAAVHAITSVDDAVTSLRAGAFDVVVTSVFRGDDAALLRLASVTGSHGEVPIVVLGDDAEPDTAAAICRKGAHEYLVEGDLDERALARAVLCAHERARRTRRLIDDAHQDELTQVANRKPLRARFHEMRYRALHGGGDLACVVVDLDGFKRINDTFGHHVGDEVLAAIAARLLASVRATDLVARLGGDEFAVLLDRVEQRAYGEIVERLERALAEPLAVDGYLVPVSASVGLGTGSSEETKDLSELLKRADADMYRKKTRRMAGAKG